jgi:hypothetical protein
MIPPPTASLFSIAFYDVKKKIILKYGSSRACGYGHNQKSIHAEQLALNEYRSLKKNRNIRIYIWRYKDDGNTKPAMCCHRCNKLVHKYNIEHIIYTFDNDKIISAIPENPEISLAYKIMHFNK